MTAAFIAFTDCRQAGTSSGRAASKNTFAQTHGCQPRFIPMSAIESRPGSSRSKKMKWSRASIFALANPGRPTKHRAELWMQTDGQAIPNTRLHCLGFNDNDRPPKDVPVITNDQGQFKITELISGQYALYLLEDEDVSGPYYSEGTRFVVNDGDVSGLEVKAYRGSTVSGVVVAAGVTDPAIKSKLQGARLFVSFLGDRDPATANPGNLPGSSSKISAEGRFRFNGSPPGKLMFLDHLGSVNDGPGRIPFTFNRIERDGAQINQVIEIRRGEHVENLRIIVDYANGSIRGQVKIVGGNLPQGWRLQVYASRTGASEKSGGSQSRGAFVRVDESGRFLIEGLTPGEVEFEVTAVVQNNADGEERPSGAEAVRQRVTVNNDVVTSVTINFDPSRRRQ